MERRLHRGLEALMGKAKVPVAATQTMQAIPVEQIRPNPKQPRHHFDDAELEDLKNSIDRDGLLQPVVVRRIEGGFELVAGERRWRACKALGLVRIPAVIRAVRDEEQLVLALVENLQRSNLDATEEALGYQQLQAEFGLTHEQVAQKVGKNRTTVTNTLRLLELPEVGREALAKHMIRAGHGRALVPIATHPAFGELLERVIEEGLSVRQTEELVKLALGGSIPAHLGGLAVPGATAGEVGTLVDQVDQGSDDLDSDDLDSDDLDAGDQDNGEPAHDGGSHGSPRDTRTPAVLDLEDRLRGAYGVPVRIQIRRRGGSITFRCADRQELDYLLDKLQELRRDRSGDEADDGFHV